MRLRKAVDKTKAVLDWDEEATLKAADQGGRLARLAGEAFAAYDREKQAAGMLDFDDLLIKTRDLLRDARRASARPARARARACSSTSSRTPTRSRGKSCGAWRGRTWVPGRLFLVGDPKQSIYRFRGPEPRIFQEFRERVPRGGASAS